MKKIHIVLYNPEIPQNTGNISRTCAVTGASLHIIRPCGFEISDRTLKRAGLDYWDKLDVHYYDSFAELEASYPTAQMYFFSSKGTHTYTDVTFPEEVFLVFGKETAGLPRELIDANMERTLRMPMLPTLRCLNLSNAVAIATYEVLRQFGFEGLV